jgi:hypothetical protein
MSIIIDNIVCLSREKYAVFGNPGFGHGAHESPEDLIYRFRSGEDCGHIRAMGDGDLVWGRRAAKQWGLTWEESN